MEVLSVDAGLLMKLSSLFNVTFSLVNYTLDSIKLFEMVKKVIVQVVVIRLLFFFINSVCSRHFLGAAVLKII